MKIQTIELTKVYTQGDKKIYALHNINIEIFQNKFTAITGASGSGKSTLLRAIGALEKPSLGEVLFDDEDIYKFTSAKRAKLRRKKLGFVFQDYGLLPTLTALENIYTPVLMDNQKPDKDYISNLCDTLGISDRIHHIPSEMSGGEQQRVSVARALANRPEIIFADEPTGNLDKKSASDLLELLLLTKEKFNQTLLIVTHDPKIAEYADIILRMDNGEIL